APEVGCALARARELCRQVGGTVRLFAALIGLRDLHANRGELQVARALDEECLTLAQRQHDPALLLQAHTGLGITLYFLGEFVPARAHLEQAIALAAPQQDHASTPQTPAGVPCLAYAAFTLWMLGYPEQALMRSHAMLTYAQGLSHVYSLARALHYTAELHQYRREGATAQERAEA